MDTEKIIVKKLKITRDLVSDGIKPVSVQLKIVPVKSDPLISGFAFQVDPKDLIPDDFDAAELILSDPETGVPTRMGRPVFQVVGTMTIELMVEKEISVPVKKPHK